VLAVARRSTAEEHNLPILGVLATATDGADLRDQAVPAHSLPVLAGAGHTYLSLDALLTVLKGVVTATDTVVTPAAAGSPLIRFTRPAGPDRPSPARPGTAQAAQVAGRRQTFQLVPTPAPQGGSAAPAIPPGSVVITDAPDLAAAVTGPDVAVWSPRPGPGPATHVPAESAPDALAGLPFIPRHVRVLSRLAVHGDGSTDAEAARMEDLQDLTFATLQAALPALRAGGSLGAVLLGPLPDDLPPPLSGLFTGWSAPCGPRSRSAAA
jgi:hypothetical protein